ncbi:hypothetical protein QO207_11730 [Pseudomonas sp. CAN2814]|uniref:hypothetical protein n=1 Tax=Pseudomonas sp. CAN1 TaxID=3046726 RepID=UPI0026478CAF|nr:hypothetical protein [Pseudomonas sp. CAN1]MDN6857257.1 hypothetical protein [Pseudomonas sp. CAN1]
MTEFLAWFEQHPGLASWLQAVGVVVSLGGAIWISNLQTKHQQRLELERHKQAVLQRIEAFIGLAEFAIQEMSRAFTQMGTRGSQEGYAQRVYERSTFNGMVASLEAFPIHDLPDARVVGAAMRIVDSARIGHSLVATVVESYRKHPPTFDEALSDLGSLCQYTRAQLDIATEAAMEYMAQVR